VNINYNNLLAYDLQFHDNDRVSLSMKWHFHPVSITEDEFRFIRDFIKDHGYRSGYEVATAFGVSSCAIGLGLKANGGSLISMDCYIEEQYNYATLYQGVERELYPEADGLKIAQKLRTHFDLEDTVEFVVGWSPDDVPAVLGDRQLDFVFIDAAHFDVNLLADIDSIRDRLMPGATVMIHDVPAFSDKTFSTVNEWLGVEIVKPFLHRSYGLGYWTKAS
jgi:predicted O-methyltransferase YrrM